MFKIPWDFSPICKLWEKKNPMGEKIPWENRKSHGKMQKSHGNPNFAYKFHSEENAFFE
jgi:hypothetical protein